MSADRKPIDWERIMLAVLAVATASGLGGVLNNGGTLDAIKQERLEAEFDDETYESLERKFDRLRRRVNAIEDQLGD